MTACFRVAWIFLVSFFATFSYAEWNATPDNWKCENRVSGDWTFGIAPYGCDASSFGNDEHITINYQPVLFQQELDYSTERNRYMQETYSMIKEVADSFIRSRKPNVSNSEVAAFQHATLAIAHQESFWSHYRKAKQDGRFKMMRGDFGHGHGLMQVDDRAHYTATLAGKGWEMVANMLYSLDEYYIAWNGASSKWCIQQYGNTWRNRSREAYSQYNGGPSSSCRWTNPDHKWARNDVGFAQKYDQKSWENYVDDLNRAATINVSCLVNGGSNCPPNGSVDTGEWYNKLLQTYDLAACVFDGEQLHCVEDMRHSACLASVGAFDSSVVTELPESDTFGIARRTYDPHLLCPDNVVGLSRVASFIELTKDNNLRLTPNGELIHSIEAGTRLQVLDASIYDNINFNRFYKVSHQDKTGYIWGGNQSNYKEWTTAALNKPENYSIPVINDWVSIEVDLLNFRATPGGEILYMLEHATPVLIKGMVIKGSNNQIYLHITHQGQEGYIYAGYQLPESTMPNWVIKTTPLNNNQAAYCPDGSSYDSDLMVCRNQTDTYGPFNHDMHQRCNEWGGGQACDEKFAVSINGQSTTLNRWATEWFMNIRENSECSYGSFRSEQYGWHCVEKNSSGEITDVYGPFDTSMVDKCLATGGGNACYYNRWSAAGFLNWSTPQ